MTTSATIGLHFSGLSEKQSRLKMHVELGIDAINFDDDTLTQNLLLFRRSNKLCVAKIINNGDGIGGVKFGE